MLSSEIIGAGSSNDSDAKMSNPLRILPELETVWGKCVAEHGRNRQSGRLRGRPSDHHSKPDNQVLASVSDSINQLSRDWNFLNMLVLSISQWSDADKLMQQAGRSSSPTHLKITDLHQEICKDIKALDFGKPKDLLIAVANCQRKTDELVDGGIRERLEHLSSLTLRHYPYDYSFWGTFMNCVTQNLQSIKDVVDGSLKEQICVPIANQSCDFWFNRKDIEISRTKASGFPGLVHQMDLTNREFRKLILGFQEVLYQTPTLSPCIGSFCHYILGSRSHSNLLEKLTSLVSAFIECKQRSNSFGEDVHCLFEEIDAMIAEAAFLHRSVYLQNKTDYVHPRSHLLVRLRILMMELYLKKQLDAITSSMLFGIDFLFEVNEILKDLKGFTDGLYQHGEAEHGKYNSIQLAEGLNREVESLYVSYQPKKKMTKAKVIQLLYKLVIFKAESFLSELLKGRNGESFIPKHQIESLALELKYFKRVVTISPFVRNLPDELIIFVDIETFARRISILSYSFQPNKEKFEQVLLSLSELFRKAKDIKAKLRKFSPEFPTYNYPKTYGEGFIHFLARKIMELLNYDPESIASVKPLLEKAQPHLESFQSFLRKVSGFEGLNGELGGLCSRIRNLAYELEYAVELMEVDDNLKHSLWLHSLLEHMRLVDENISSISEVSCTAEFQSLPQVACDIITKNTTSAIAEPMVDLVDEAQVILQQLTGGSSQRSLVSIVGMPVYSKRNLLLDLQSDIHGRTNELYPMSDEDLQSKLRRHLLRNKYLIVMDDIWDIAAWNDLKISFPDDNNGSRILITTRHIDLPLAIKPGSVPHHMRFFSDEESWMLLEKKIFKGADCPKELLLVGKKIAQLCQGLPLATVAVAGLLQKTEKTHDWWDKVSQSLSSQVINDPGNRCKEMYDEPYASLPASEYDMEFHNKHNLDPVTFENYRLSFCLRRSHFFNSRPSGPTTKSLIFFASEDKEPRCPYEISFICNNFKLLRLLDLECVNVGTSFPAEIGLMVQLRYLAVSGYVQSIPPSIANLWRLEILVVKGFRGTVILHDTVWSMARLRHLHVNEHVRFTSKDDDDERVGSSSDLDNLVSFSTPSLFCGDNTINIMRRLPNLLKLRCIFLESWDSSKGSYQFPVLDFLARLESLKIIYYGGAINSGEFVLPFSLRELTLSKFRLPWSHISRIGELPNLTDLKLLSGAFEGSKWEMKEDQFKKLKFLKLDTLNIVEWVASYDDLPTLERLVVRNCKDLEEIPYDISYIATLESIEVLWCGESVEESARRIGSETPEIKIRTSCY
ncbi:OLC1v1019916C1 [Oldenlandia corymbosa var. corymbosa]|uniref:OLC1v1019916C1 n=1 Tax=Oldenlandia corymbosa var. corymbosa TaxID=529605 RepID=A0AAV1EF23_OLDCO|nr:OLC1v1019916C1 [Oldenlandia corymbosa var. corymbosa]